MNKNKCPSLPQLAPFTHLWSELYLCRWQEVQALLVHCGLYCRETEGSAWHVLGAAAACSEGKNCTKAVQHPCSITVQQHYSTASPPCSHAATRRYKQATRLPWAILTKVVRTFQVSLPYQECYEGTGNADTHLIAVGVPLRSHPMVHPEKQNAFVPRPDLQMRTQPGKANTFIASKMSLLVLPDSFKSLVVFNFSYEKPLCLNNPLCVKAD